MWLHLSNRPSAQSTPVVFANLKPDFASVWLKLFNPMYTRQSLALFEIGGGKGQLFPGMPLKG